jgi:8-oxo-dGTP diphosphatase
MIVVSFIIPVRVRSGQYQVWLQVRSESGQLDGKLEFPGGKLERGESPVETAVRELKEETGQSIDPLNVHAFDVHEYRYPDRSVLLYSHLAYLPEFMGESGQWFELNGEFLAHKNHLDANRTILKDVLAYLDSQKPYWQQFQESQWPKS